ncbi:MAG: hypothetical protein DMG22_10465 [Acidobacteria bacterium]|nr:MAG: hypothetical protein DMG22_10465 [Acidobacteriota bacterium]
MNLIIGKPKSNIGLFRHQFSRTLLFPTRALALRTAHDVILWCSLAWAIGGVLGPMQAAALLQRESNPGRTPSEVQPAAPRPGNDEALLFSQVDHCIADRKLDEAEVLLQDYLHRSPDSAGALYRLGRVFFDRHNWSASTAYLLRSLKINDQNDRAHLILGLDYFQLNRIEEAGRELLTAVKQNPQSDENQYMAGRYFFTKSKRTEALAFFYEAVRLNAENFKAYHSLGLCFANLGNYALAENYYKQAIEIAEKQNIKFQQGYLDLADLLTGIESTKVSEGEIFARRAAELSPDSSEAHFLVGKALFREGEHIKALPELLRSINLDPKDSRPHFLLAKIYQKLNRQADAEAEYEKFRQLMKFQTERGQTASSRSLSPVH